MSAIQSNLAARNVRLARRKWGPMTPIAASALRAYSNEFGFSVALGDVLPIDNAWYATFSGLLRLARRNHCAGIESTVISELCDPASDRYVFKATVFTSRSCKGFSAFGDADLTNTPLQFRGAVMRTAETRSTCRALRRAYGVAICAVEEVGSLPREAESSREPKKLAQPANGNGSRPVRDRLCQVIRQHSLDPELVKNYAANFCGTKTLREATRAQVENFVEHLADWAEKDRNALLCQLNSYLPCKEKGGTA
jgi:hypothetical protein